MTLTQFEDEVEITYDIFMLIGKEMIKEVEILEAMGTYLMVCQLT